MKGRLDGSRCSITTRSMLPSAWSSSTKHQSAKAGTVARATASSVADHSSECESSRPAAASSWERRRARLAKVTSSNVSTLTFWPPSTADSRLTASVRVPSGPVHSISVSCTADAPPAAAGAARAKATATSSGAPPASACAARLA